MLKVLIAPDKFKHSLSAAQICEIVSQNLPRQYLKQSVPLADGGQGTLEVIQSTLGADRVCTSVCDPLLRPIRAEYLSDKSQARAHIEMAKASGLCLLKQLQKNPLKTSSIGTGQLILHAIQQSQCKQVDLYVGGSATNEGGIGMANALGYRFLDQHDSQLQPIGENLIRIRKIKNQLKINLQGISFKIVSDVRNVLCGGNGTSRVYGPQKGASSQAIDLLERGLTNLDRVYQEHTGKSYKDHSGSGAAGGLGFAGLAFLDASIESGIDRIMQIVDLEDKVKKADIVITGEGKIDGQTLNGKVIEGVSELCRKWNKKLIILCGQNSLRNAEMLGRNIQIIPLQTQGISHEYSINNAGQLLGNVVRNRFSSM